MSTTLKSKVFFHRVIILIDLIPFFMMNELTYYYCVVHKKCLYPEDVELHRTESCEFVLEEAIWKHKSKRKLQWLPQNVVDAYGMQIYIPKKKSKQVFSTLPKSAKIYETPRRQLGQ